MLHQALLLIPLALLLLLSPSHTAGDVSLEVSERFKREPLPVPAPAPAAAPGSADSSGTAAKPVSGKAAAGSVEKKDGAGKGKVKNGKKKAAGSQAKNKSGKKTKGDKKGKAAKSQNGKAKKGGKTKTGKNKKKSTKKKTNNKAKKNKKNKSGKSGNSKKNKAKKNKSGKSKKNKSGKSKKNKSGKSRHNKSGKSKKNKSGKSKKKNKSGKGTKSVIGSARAQNDSCVLNMVLILGALGSTVRTVDQTTNRVQNFLSLQSKKLAKNGDFNSSAETLTSALGGNTTTPTCGSTKQTNSSEPLGNLTLLNSCSKSVNSACVGGNPPPAIDTCGTLVSAYRNATAKITALNQTADQICAAVAAFNVSLVTAMSACATNVVNLAKNITSNKNNCTVAFANCRQAQRNIIPLVYDCKPGPGGAANREDAVAQLNASTAVRNAAVSMVNSLTTALATAGLSTGPGADGNPPATGRATRLRRQATTDGAKCLAVQSNLATANTSATATAASVASPVDLTSANTATTAMNTLANSQTLVDDLKTCGTSTSKATIIIAIVQIRIYIFWINNWRITVIDIKITLLVASFNLPSPATVAPITTAAATTPAAVTSSTASTLVTKAPVGMRREKIFQILNRVHMN